jgi:hypothetical protein
VRRYRRQVSSPEEVARVHAQEGEVIFREHDIKHHQWPERQPGQANIQENRLLTQKTTLLSSDLVVSRCHCHRGLSHAEEDYSGCSQARHEDGADDSKPRGDEDDGVHQAQTL